MHRGFVAVFAIAVVAAFVAGCGGGSSDGSSAESLTKAEFIKQGDVVCRKAEEVKNKGLQAAFKDKAFQEASKGNEKAVQEKLVIEVALPPIADMTEELDELGPPDAQAEAVVASFEDVVGELEAEPATAFGSENPFAEPDGLAKKYGFTECAGI